MTVGALALGVAVTVLVTSSVRGAERVERRLHVMGTTLALVVDAPTRAEALAASEAVAAGVQAAEARLTTWTDASELSHFNASQVGTPFQLTPALARDLASVLHCHETTAGAFSPGMGRLVQAWDLRGGGRRPGDEEIRDLLPALRAKGMYLTGDRATRLDERFVVEEGGFGKGVGLDDAVERLRSTAAVAALLDLGGQILLWGDTRATVDLAHPRHRDRVVLSLDAERGSVATSGNSERGIRVDGQRLGHLLDPRTGRPAPDFGSITVWTARGTEADCLSTGLYVMGPDDAARWAARHDDVAVVVIEEIADDRLFARASANLRGRLRARDEAVELQWIEPQP